MFRSDKEELVKKMAEDLRRLQIFYSEREAIIALCAKGYRFGDVAVLTDEALFEARQGIVIDMSSR